MDTQAGEWENWVEGYDGCQCVWGAKVCSAHWWTWHMTHPFPGLKDQDLFLHFFDRGRSQVGNSKGLSSPTPSPTWVVVKLPEP